MSGVLVGMESFDRSMVKLLAATSAGSGLAVRAGAEVMRDEWKATILEKGLVDTGRLYNSIDIDQEGSEALVSTDAVNPHTGQPYPFYLEYGTRFMTARPHMRPAFERGQKPAVAAVGVKLGEIIQSALG